MTSICGQAGHDLWPRSTHLNAAEHQQEACGHQMSSRLQKSDTMEATCYRAACKMTQLSKQLPESSWQGLLGPPTAREG